MLKRFHLPAHGFNDTGRLMAHDNRGNAAARAAVQAMHVAASKPCAVFLHYCYIVLKACSCRINFSNFFLEITDSYSAKSSLE